MSQNETARKNLFSQIIPRLMAGVLPLLMMVLLLVLPVSAKAQGSGGGGGGGDFQLGASLGMITTSQEHINTLISRANSRVGGISTGAMNQAYEFAGHLGYRFSGSIISMLLRPSYFYQKSSGSGTGGSFNYGVSGMTIFPMLRLYPLENNFMKFFMQLGVGYGRASSSIEEAAAKLDMAGDAFGTVFGLGAEFCFTANHCTTVEGNFRYLTMERNIASSVSGTFATGSVDQAIKDREVEMDGTDLAVRMSGLQFLAGYTFYF